MAARKTRSVRTKPSGRTRTRSRIELAEGDSRQPDKRSIRGRSAEHRSAEPHIEGLARLLDSGEILVSSQFSEVAPIGRFAGITIGPFQIAGKLGGIDIDDLADIDWQSDDPLTDAQQAAYDRIYNTLASLGKIIQHRIDDDREVVDKAVERFNRMELEDEKKPSRRKK